LGSVDREKIKGDFKPLQKCRRGDAGRRKSENARLTEADRVILEVADTGTRIADDLDVFQLFKTTNLKAPV
jgi:hypothetical protein